VTSRTLARRLNKLEERFSPAAEPMKIQVVFVEPDGTPNGGVEVLVGGQGYVRSARKTKSEPRRNPRCPQMTGHGAKFGRKKEEAIIALLTHRTICADVGWCVERMRGWS
jgi:hypothetical protein